MAARRRTVDPDPQPRKKKVGRPSGYTEAIAKKVLDRMAAGESLMEIGADDGMPSNTTIRDWAAGLYGAPATFSARYDRARELQGNAYAEQAIDMAKMLLRWGKAKENAPEVRDLPKLSPVRVQAIRTAIETHKWAAAKFYPKMFGHKWALVGEEGSPPISLEETAKTTAELKLAPGVEKQIKSIIGASLQRGEI